jgi:hypothetical protein
MPHRSAAAGAPSSAAYVAPRAGPKRPAYNPLHGSVDRDGPRAENRGLTHFLLVVLAGLALCPERAAQASQAAAPAPAPAVRVLSTASGTQGAAHNGQYVILDPRTTFRIPADTKVVVSFQWLGVPGKHQLAGAWKGPGGLSVNSAFEYVAQNREFSAYWTLPLTADVPLGPWTFEAQVDGQPAGTHAFEIVGGTGSAPPGTAAAVAVPLTRQEMLARALATMLTVEGLDTTGRPLTKGPGTLLDATTVATSFALVNGAQRLRVSTPKGVALELTEVLAFDRRRDWALLRVIGVGAPPSTRARSAEVVGNGCATLGLTADGAYSVTSCEIVGVNQYPQVGERLSISLINGNATPGAPVINDYGEIVGVVSQGLFPGSDRIQTLAMSQMFAPLQTLVIPVGVLVPADGSTPVTLAELAIRGVFTPPVVHSRHILSGGFTSKVMRDGARTQPIDQRTEFSLQDKTIAVFVTWDPKEILKGVIVLRILDQDNKVLAETKPQKAALKPGSLTMSTWEFGVPTAEGVYRTDVLFGPDVAWRGFFRVVK